MLAQLPDDEYEALAKFLQPVELTQGKELSYRRVPIEYVYFINSGMVSVDAMTEDGQSVEIAVIGREGFTGLPALLNQPQMSHAVLMQGVGDGLRVRSSIVRDQFLKGGALRSMVHSYIYLHLVQTTQSVLCNRVHEVDARLARWLLTSADRMESELLNLTHEFLASMLGVQRSTVTVAAGELQRQGLIGYSRGKIHILDRPKLTSRACECYSIVRSSYDRILEPRPDGSRVYAI
jgi:CRP-like cAMP-binding protein